MMFYTFVQIWSSEQRTKFRQWLARNAGDRMLSTNMKMLKGGNIGQEFFYHLFFWQSEIFKTIVNLKIY